MNCWPASRLHLLSLGGKGPASLTSFSFEIQPSTVYASTSRQRGPQASGSSTRAVLLLWGQTGCSPQLCLLQRHFRESALEEILAGPDVSEAQGQVEAEAGISADWALALERGTGGWAAGVSVRQSEEQGTSSRIGPQAQDLPALLLPLPSEALCNCLAPEPLPPGFCLSGGLRVCPRASCLGAPPDSMLSLTCK